MKTLRICIDTSVFGGCYDDEFSEASTDLFKTVRNTKITILVSNILVDELDRAPDNVQTVLTSLPKACVEYVNESIESRKLRNLYLKDGVVGKSHLNDAHHVAIASISNADMIVSWNFKHIVHYKKIRGFNAVNIREGYSSIAIHSPLEVI